MVHAIAVTLMRLAFTRRRLLDWETAAASEARAAGGPKARGPIPFIKAMLAGPLIALAGLALVALRRPGALLEAVPVLALWAAAPFIAYLLSRPTIALIPALNEADRAFLTEAARKTWKYFEAFMGPEDHGLPPDNFQEIPEPRVAHRTSPTNIGMGLLATLAAHDLGFITKEEMAGKIETMLITMEGLERHEGHLFNWYDTLSLAPLPPRYVSTVDSGNLAGALLALAEGLRRLGLDDLSGRAARFADDMSFRFLYDPLRQILSIGYRLADAEGAGRRDPYHYDILASESRLASFVAIAKGDLPQSHWFHLGRLTTSIDGVPTLLSWGATMFEYLMPLLLMRSFPETLLDQSCRMAVRRQIQYGRECGLPWGVSESGYNLVDRHDNYQYKAFGVPGLGLKRGLGDERVVAPYATALAAMIDPAQAARNLRRLSRAGLEGEYGYFESIDYSHDKSEEPAPEAARPRGVVIRSFLAHHQGMTLVALANALLGGPHGGAIPRRPARAGHRAAAAGARPPPGAHPPAPPGRGDAGADAHPRRGHPPLSHAAHAFPARPVPGQR